MRWIIAIMCKRIASFKRLLANKNFHEIAQISQTQIVI